MLGIIRRGMHQETRGWGRERNKDKKMGKRSKSGTSGSRAVLLEAFLHLYQVLASWGVHYNTHTHRFIQLPCSQVPFRDRQGQQLLQNLTFSVDARSRKLLACAQQQGGLLPLDWHYKICLQLNLLEGKISVYASVVNSTEQMNSVVEGKTGCYAVWLFLDEKNNVGFRTY